jgi:hypothetical protein
MRFLLLALVCASIAFAAPPPSIAEKTKGLEKHDGYFPFYWDAAQGKLLLEVPLWDTEFLYVSSLPAGIGSNDIGLDRGQLGATRAVRFTRTGPKVLLVQSNYDFRAATTDAPERRAVHDSFAESVLWGFEVLAETGTDVLIDATPFLLRDAHDVARTLQDAKQGTWKVDASRSALYLPATRNFPQNTEMEAVITFTGGPAGPWLREVTPANDAVTVRMHHSFIQLPPPGYQPRDYDPRAGYFPLSYADYATPISEPLVKRFIRRHRLAQRDPNSGEPVKPIVYYLDRGTPEPIRSALLEGARWWNQAFEAAGFRDAFRVELMPEGADLMDVRYNVIQWVHRATRGWSYGASVTDPRTGEILKGHVSLGSLRVRQDFLIGEAFLSPYDPGHPASAAALEMSLARLRQLAAHEVGHTLGLAHNYIASTRNRASVMDYPPPLIELDESGAPAFRNAYATGIGEWDKIAIRYGYTEFPAGADERRALDAILEDGLKRDLFFLTDQDARPAGSAHPETHLWDSGRNAADELNRTMKVRAAALARFGENNIRPHDALARLEDVLVPLYFGHRYQAEAAAKVVGGLYYRYAVRGDGQSPTDLVPPAEQRKALAAVLATVQPAALLLPESILRLLPPRPAGMERTRELFRGRTGLTFDPVAAAETAADMSLALLLHPQRANRLVEHHARSAAQPSLAEVLDAVISATWKQPRPAGLAGEVRDAAATAALHRLMNLAVDSGASSTARGAAFTSIASLSAWLKAQPASPLKSYALTEIAEFQKDPKQMKIPEAPAPPPGMPIGELDCDEP